MVTVPGLDGLTKNFGHYALLNFSPQITKILSSPLLVLPAISLLFHGDRLVTNPEKVNVVVQWLAFKWNRLKSLVSSQKSGPSGFGVLNVLDRPRSQQRRRGEPGQCPHILNGR